MANLGQEFQVQGDLKNDLRHPRKFKFQNSLLSPCIRTLYFVLLDSLALIAAKYISEAISSSWNPTWSFEENPKIIILVISIHISIFFFNGLYKTGRKRRDYPAIVKSVSLANLIILLVAFLHFPNALIARSAFISYWFFACLLISLGRYLSNIIVINLNHRGRFLHPVFIVSESENLKRVVQVIESCPYYRILGWDNTESITSDRIDETINHLQKLGVSEFFVHSDSLKDPMYLYWKLQHAGITLYLLSKDLTPTFREAELVYIDHIPCFKMNEPSITGFNFILKRSLDVLCSGILLILLSPIYILTSLLIILDNPGSIFYRQTRIGLHGKPFKIWKFRTMCTNAEHLQQTLESQNKNQDGILFKIENDPRITRLGHFLRRYSLDELPQILNVFLGEMSFVGPRPLPLRDVTKFAEHHHIRHEVLPGITGLWQISGRSDIQNFDDALKLDTQYIEQWSLWLDLKILVETISVVLTKSGAY
jgi:exopolysaccharide biosynthesis polyprenyl glycosylphosphotransferase